MPKKKKVHKRLVGFTLIELLVSMGIIGVLSSIVIVAVNPSQQIINAADAQRTHSASELLKAIQQYNIDHGVPPNEHAIPDVANGDASICRQGVTDPTCLNFDVLVPTYLVSIPVDNNQPCSADSGYGIAKVGSLLQVDSLNLGSDYPNTDCDYNSLPVNTALGYLGYWRLDEQSGTTATDGSNNGNNGTYVGGSHSNNVPATIVFSDSASVQLNGSSDYVSLGTNLFAGLGAFTVSAWVKPSNSTGIQAILSQWKAQTNAQMVLLRINNGVLEGFVHVTKGSKIAGGSFAMAIPAGTWSHVVFQYNGTKLIAVVNGQYSPVTFAVNSAVKSSTSTTLSIGGQNRTAADGYFNGQIDDFRIYNRALTSAEIASIASGN